MLDALAADRLKIIRIGSTNVSDAHLASVALTEANDERAQRLTFQRLIHHRTAHKAIEEPSAVAAAATRIRTPQQSESAFLTAAQTRINQ
jgi:hypothetical protein